MVVLACLLIEARRNKYSWLVIYTPLLLLQPAWRLAWGEVRHGGRTMSADCGFGDRGESIFLALMLVAIFVVLVRGDSSKRLFFLILTIVCSITYVLAFVLGLTPLPFAILSRVVSPEVAGQVWGSVEGGAGRLSSYAVMFAVICAILYVQERRRSRVLVRDHSIDT
jgi:hypothetical protein